MRRLATVGIMLLLIGCQRFSDLKVQSFGVERLHQLNSMLLEIAMEDGFSPPVASRVYAYPHIAHYITIQLFYPDSLPAIAGKLNGLTPLEGIEMKDAHPELTSLLAFCKTAKKVVFSEDRVVEEIGSLMNKARASGLSTSVISDSDSVSDVIVKQLIAWIDKDNYIETRTMDRWTSTKRLGDWIETPPDYSAGLEPHWSKIRPLVLDSAGIFRSTPPPAYDPAEQSDFYKMVNAVYLQSRKLDEDKVSIAMYWDDNPNTSEHRGHQVSVIHKISPPGHWLNIISQVCRRENSSFFKATQVYTYTAIAMFDAIISCWYEKYKTNLVRPITYIQENIDPEWVPLIQTPPFPEYTSGHSVISAAAATILTDTYGENHAFSDSTEVLFGHPVRSFKSFHDAAWEVSMSRFYAGIHYMNGITEGNRQGNFIGQLALEVLE